MLSEIGLNLLERLANLSSANPAGTPAHLLTGEEGERAALFYLRRQGFTIVARRWRSGRAAGDLDLIAWEGDTLCFIEVKTRTTRAIATAEAAVNEHKRRTLRRMARHYLRQVPKKEEAEPPTRFDILSVYFEDENAAKFELFRGAFDWI